MSSAAYDVDVAPPTPQPLEISEINDLWEKQNPHSILNMLPASLVAHFEKAKREHPQLFDMPEEQLRMYIKTSTGQYPASSENQLRLRLWYEINLAIANGDSEISARRLCAGVCSTNLFYHYVKRPQSIAWLVCMPTSFEQHLEEMINVGASWAKRVMNMEDVDPITKRVNTKLMQIKASLYQAAEMRRLGGIPQLTKNLNFNAHTPRLGQEAIETHGDKITENRIEDMLLAQKKKLLPPALETVNEEIE